MENYIVPLIGGAGMAAIISGVFGVIMFRLNRKAQQDDKRDEIIASLDKISKKLDAHIAQDKEDKISDMRIRILTFFDDETHGFTHSKEHWIIIVENIDDYEDYCKAHPTYANCKAEIAITYLKEKFAEKLKNNDF